MALFSPQIWFCNCCGKEMFTNLCSQTYGSKFRCCSLECFREMSWRETLSIMGAEYEERDRQNEESI